MSTFLTSRSYWAARRRGKALFLLVLAVLVWRMWVAVQAWQERQRILRQQHYIEMERADTV